MAAHRGQQIRGRLPQRPVQTVGGSGDTRGAAARFAIGNRHERGRHGDLPTESDDTALAHQTRADFAGDLNRFRARQWSPQTAAGPPPRIEYGRHVHRARRPISGELGREELGESFSQQRVGGSDAERENGHAIRVEGTCRLACSDAARGAGGR
jgi:hypothetical protein